MSEYHETAFARDDKTGEFKTLMVNYGFVKYYQRKEHHEWNASRRRGRTRTRNPNPKP